MNRPGGSEGVRSSNERTAITDEIHDQDAPLDGQLLDDDDSTTLRMLCNLGEVHRYLGGCDSDSDTVKDSSGDQHATTNSGCLDGGSNEPEHTAIK